MSLVVEPVRDVSPLASLDPDAGDAGDGYRRGAPAAAHLSNLRDVDGHVHRRFDSGLNDGGLRPLERFVAQVFAGRRDVNRAAAEGIRLIVILGPRGSSLDRGVGQDGRARAAPAGGAEGRTPREAEPVDAHHPPLYAHLYMFGLHSLFLL